MQRHYKQNSHKLVYVPCISSDHCETVTKDNLGFIMKKPAASMSYSHYQMDIVEKYSIKLIGWPARLLPMTSPSDICVLANLRLLHDALVKGSCRWVHLSQPEVQQRIDEHQ